MKRRLITAVVAAFVLAGGGALWSRQHAQGVPLTEAARVVASNERSGGGVPAELTDSRLREFAQTGLKLTGVATVVFRVVADLTREEVP